MAKYRQVHTSFWNDGFVLDLTPEEKYFYIYLMTNSKTTQCGVYELPKRIIETETGYNHDTIQKLLQRFVDYGKIDYYESTKEIIINNWIKYNPPNNHNAQKCINKELKEIKNVSFMQRYIKLAAHYCEANHIQYDVLFEGIENEAPYKPLQEKEKPLPSNKVISNKEEIISKKEEVITAEEISATKPSKKKYADFVSMTEEEYSKLISQYGETLITDKITDLSLWKGSKGKRTNSDYLTILTWIRKDIKESKGVKNAGNSRDIERELKDQGIGL